MLFRFPVLLAVALFVPFSSAAAQTTTFVGLLDQLQQTPAPVPTAATAAGGFTLDAATSRVTYSVRCSNLSGAGATAGHIHGGLWAEPGAIEFTLAQTGPSSFDGITDPLSAAQLTALSDEGLYCDVHTALNAGGEVRGQIVLQSVLEARWGNVDTAGGGMPFPVLAVGAQIGHPVYRELVRSAGPTSIAVLPSPSLGSGLYAIWILPGRSTGATLTPCVISDGAGGTETLGIAAMCLPANNNAVPHSCPCPPPPFSAGYTSKSISGANAAALVCLHRAPPDSRVPALLPVNFPVGTWTVAGVIADPGSSSGPRKVSLTNVVTVIAK